MALIREARLEDLVAVVEIHNALLETTTYEWTETAHTVAEWSECFRDKKARDEPLVVAELDGVVVGWATYGDFRDTGRWPGYRPTVEHSIHVRQDHWGRGIGRQLLKALAERAGAADKRVMVAGIDSTNVGSIAFHRRLGFREVARMPGVGRKWNKPLDLVLMQRELDRPL